MAGTEGRFDADTLGKIEQINRKIDEINQRKMGVHTTWAEDELDRLELNAYIDGLKLTPAQRQIVDRYNRNNDPPSPAGSRWIGFAIVAAGVFFQVYIGCEVYRLVTKGSLEALEAGYLGLLVLLFAFNAFQMLRYLRVVR